MKAIKNKLTSHTCYSETHACHPETLTCHSETHACHPETLTCYSETHTCHPETLTCYSETHACHPETLTCHPEAHTCHPERSRGILLPEYLRFLSPKFLGCTRNDTKWHVKKTQNDL